MVGHEVTILLVEDDDIDAQSVVRGLHRARITCPLVRARDGVEALDLLRGTNDKQKLKAPYLLLVDIRMPRLDGIGLIRAIRADARLSRTVIFMLTTSDNDRDKLAAYDSHVAGYIVKSSTSGDFQPLMALIEYYLMIVAPPPDTEAMAATY